MIDLKELFKNLEEDTEKSMWQRRGRFTKTELAAYLEGKKIHHQKFLLLLGEWAWDNCKKDLNQALWNHRDMEFDGMCYFIFNTWYNKEKKYDEHWVDVYFEIAVACLGKKEVIKRLKWVKE